MAGVAGEYEEIIAEAVEVTKYKGLDEQLFFLQTDAGPFGAAADTARDMGRGYGDMSAG